MSLHFIFGRAGTGKSTRCAEEIRQYLSGAPSRTACLIVPDQATYRAETMLAAACPGQGFLNACVYGFARLSWRLRQELRCGDDDALSPLMQQLILRRILLSRKDSLSQLGSAARQPHFAGTLTAFFHQLDAFGVSEDALAALAREEEGSPMGRKLADLAALRADYRDYLAGHFRYRGNVYDKLAEDIPRSRFLRDARVWIDGFNGMIPQELSVVSALVRTARDVTVTLPMDTPEEAAGNRLWSRPYRMWEALQKEAGAAGSVTLRNAHRFTCPRLRDFADRFFSPIPQPCRYPPATRILPGQGLFIAAAPSREEEAAAAARQIAGLARESGYRWREILVLVRRPDPYMDLLRKSFEDCRIPAFFDQRQPMKSHPLVILIRSLLRFLAAGSKGPWRNWTKELLFPLLKTDLLHAFSPEETDRLENYVLRIGIRPSQWKTPWKFHNPFHLENDGDMPSPRELEELNEMNELRTRLLAFLIPLEDQWKEAKTVREKCALLYRWLLDQQVPDTLALWDEKSYAETRERPHAQVFKKWRLLAEDLVRAAGDDPVSAAEFLAMTDDGLSSLTFAMIPPTLDHVTVTAIDRGYPMEARAVFLLGASEGDFPARIEETGLLTEEEKRTARRRGNIRLGPDLEALIDQEHFYTYLSLTRARDALYLSYPAADSDGSELSPSVLLQRIQQAGYCTAVLSWDAPSPKTADPSVLVTPEQSLSLLPRILRESLPEEGSVWQPLRDWALRDPAASRLLHRKLQGFSYRNSAGALSPATAARLFMPTRPFRTSVTRMETYRHCPYQFFLRYGLRLEEREQGRLDSRDFGSYLHAGLHRFGDFLSAQRQSWRDATDEDIDRLSARIAEAVAPRVKSGALLSDGAARYTERALNRTFRAALRRFRAWSASGDADTVAMEESFRLRLETDAGVPFLIDCQIDRVDAAAGAAVVCDYKTGTPDLTLAAIASGYRLQLITYLMAVIDSKEETLLPGALLYIYLKGNALTVPVPADGVPDPRPKELSGYFLDNPDVLGALDRNLGTDAAFLPLTRNKTGAWSARAPVLSMEEINALFTLTRKRLLGLYENLRRGDISIRPVRWKESQSPCAWCPYKSICRFDPRRKDNAYEDIEALPDSAVRKQLAETPSHSQRSQS